jgi:protein O-mannosyl-transferase
VDTVVSGPFFRKRFALSRDQMKIAMCILLAAFTLIVYRQAGRFEFLWFDDGLYVTDNPHVKSGLNRSSVAWSFSFEDKEKTYWHPLTWLSHMLDLEMYGLHAGPHHLTNVALHLINSLLLFFGLSGLTGSLWRSFFVAGLFAVHPINVESVAWVASRKNLLSTTFWILTTYAYVGYAKKPGMARYFALALTFLLGLLAKPMLVTLPCTLLLLDFWPLRRLRFACVDPSRAGMLTCGPSFSAVHRRQELVMEKIPLLVLSILVSWLAADSMKDSGAVIPFDAVPLALRVENALVSYTTYIANIFWPVHLSVFYPYPEAVSFWSTGFAVVVVIGVGTCACRMLSKRPYFIVGWLWFLGTLVPVSGVIQVGLWPALADRWLYIPSIGLFVVIIWGGHDFLLRRRGATARAAGVAAMMVMLFSLTAVSYRQAAVWENGVSLFEHALRQTQNNYVAHNNLGAELYVQGRSEESLFHFHEAIRIKPGYYLANNNIGMDALHHGRLEDAESWFSKALAVNPLFAEGHKQMAITKFKLGKIKEALEHFGAAAEIDPRDKTIQYDLGCVLSAIGQPEKAVRFFQNALRLDPDYADANQDIGVAYLHLGQTENATRHFEKALAVKPEYAPEQLKLKEALVSRSQ